MLNTSQRPADPSPCRMTDLPVDPTTAALDRRSFLRRLGAAGGAIALASIGGACDVREYARAHGAKLRLSIATGPIGGTYYVYGGGLASVISRHIPNVEATAELTGASVDNLKFLRMGRADLAFCAGTSLYEAYSGTESFATIGRVPVRALAVLYIQPMHFVTFADKHIRSLADLRGKVVSTGTPGSGTDEIVPKMLRAAGLDPATDVRRHRLSPANAAEALRDGKIDAFFWSAGVPSAAVLDLATSFRGRLRLVPSADVLASLQRPDTPPLFIESIIPGGSYPGIRESVATVGVATVLVADASLSDSLAYDITRVLFDQREELGAIHAEALRLTPEFASRGSPIPFHPGAARYYRERGMPTTTE
jgi:TRAP transporter TAXI family solute receptor